MSASSCSAPWAVRAPPWSSWVVRSGRASIAVAAGVDKLEFCRRLGADVLVDRNAESVREAVVEATGGRGADLIYDPVGGAPAASAARALAAGGRLLAVGFASGEWVTMTTSDLVRRNASLVGVYAGGLTPEENERDHEALLALASAGTIGGFATAVPFDQLPEGVEKVAAGVAIGKYVASFPGLDEPDEPGSARMRAG